MSKKEKQQLGRPRLKRHIRFNPKFDYFKPRGIPLSALEIIELTHEEIEALRLTNMAGLEQLECAKKMKTSQSTLQRILLSARKKVTEALIEGKALKILISK